MKIKEIIYSIARKLNCYQTISINKFYLCLFAFTISMLTIQITFFPNSNIMLFSILYGLIFFIFPIILFTFYVFRLIFSIKAKINRNSGNNHDK